MEGSSFLVKLQKEGYSITKNKAIVFKYFAKTLCYFKGKFKL